MKWLCSRSPTVSQIGFVSKRLALYATMGVSGVTLSAGAGFKPRSMSYISLHIGWGKYDRGVRFSRYNY